MCWRTWRRLRDWQPMRTRMEERSGARQPPKFLKNEETDEVRAFLAWARTITSPSSARATTSSSSSTVRTRSRSFRAGLGVLREPKLGGVSATFAELPKELRRSRASRTCLCSPRRDTRATVHRPGYLDYIGVKRLRRPGQVIGERRFVGLYTSSPTMPTRARCAAAPQGRARGRARGFREFSHAHKTCSPSCTTTRATSSSRSTTTHSSRPRSDPAPGRPAPHARVHPPRRLRGFYSCLVFLPRESFQYRRAREDPEVLRAPPRLERGVNGAPVRGHARAASHLCAALPRRA